MPLLEAPAENAEFSPESSLQPELPLVLAPLPGPVAMAQMRMPPAEFRQLQQQQLQQQQEQQLPQLQRNNRRNLAARRNSYDRDVPIAEETEHFPAFVHLLPVVLPPQGPEPTLDELLRRVTERTDLENVETVRLRVISYTISLSRLSLFLPRLQHLDLSGSVLSSLRDLGYGLMQLTHLNISNCGLQSFDGTSGLPAIRVLIADSNMIQRVGPLSELSQLQVLQARNNRISELGLLSFLGLCAQLLEVELGGNTVCRLPLYRDTLRRSVPTLQLLDGQPLDNDLNMETPPPPPVANVDETDVSSGSETAARPATAPHNNNNNDFRPVGQRPASAVLTLDASNYRRQSTAAITATPVAGSVLGLVRQRRRRSGHAWVSSSSGSSASSSAASTRAPSISSSNSSLDMHSTSYAFSARSTLD